MTARIIILSGERGAGKSTVCRKTVALAQAQGYTCGGLITLRCPGDDLDVLDTRAGSTRRLTLGPDDSPAVIQGRFRFNPGTLAWGNNVLARATPCDLLVVDELGPLEIEQGWGWQQALTALRKAEFTLALVVVRPGLVMQVQLKLPESALAVLTVTDQNRDGLPATLLGILEREM
ncbi:MAG: nucleoside-triphosphatase [Chloroflexota bacterium]|nr:nucleoside-triphosphatase [Chloroflexota bacterium]